MAQHTASGDGGPAAFGEPRVNPAAEDDEWVDDVPEVYGKPFHGWSCACEECLGCDEAGVPRPGEAPLPPTRHGGTSGDDLAVLCPDGGACHHRCTGPCQRVRTSGPLSGVYPGDQWPKTMKETNRG